MTGEIQKWADVAMFTADPIDQEAGPQVTLLSCNPDPLGSIAAAALMYEGKSVQSLSEITDEQRRHYLSDARKTALAAPLEFVNLHFIISGVTRGFTHQMVRQRSATYTQESTRFAVKEVVPVGRPPSLDGTIPWKDWRDQCARELFPGGWAGSYAEGTRLIDDYATTSASKEQLWRKEWDEAVGDIESTYNALVSAGMPAEDARGLLPTNLLTRINYQTNLRGLQEHAGLRLCTQAQFEWRLVWNKMLEAIREFGKDEYYTRPIAEGDPITTDGLIDESSAWQFEELAGIFKPICYYRGSCQFNADVDRACKIKSRVEEYAAHGVPSSEWHKGHVVDASKELFISPISDDEWMMDPAAARVSQ